MILISREPVLENRLTSNLAHDLTLQCLAPTLTYPEHWFSYNETFCQSGP